MAMTGAGLALAITNELQTIPDYQLRIEALAVWTKVATAIVQYIQEHAQVTVAVTSVSGVTPGIGVSGAGAGAGTVS